MSGNLEAADSSNKYPYELPVAVAIDIDTPENIREILIKRLRQSHISRMCEYITGLSLEDPNIAERLAADQSIVRGKYGLPSIDAVLENPGSYEDFLRIIAQIEGIEIASRQAFREYFLHNPASGAFFPHLERLGVDINRDSYDRFTTSLITLEHEVIHAMQNNRTPSMPPEVKEYEAYIAGGNDQEIRSSKMRKNLFLGMYRSVVRKYPRWSATSDAVIEHPEWIRASFFMEHIDGVDISGLSDINKQALDLMG